MDFHQKKGGRWDSYKGYVEPILNRATLTVRRFSHVTKVSVFLLTTERTILLKRNFCFACSG